MILQLLNKLSNTLIEFKEPNPDGQPSSIYLAYEVTNNIPEEANKEYDTILNIILTYQDRFAF